MIKDKQTKVFDEFPTVDCNECERYWTNQCDGVCTSKINSKGSTMPCNSFLATRSVVIPEKIKRLEKAIKWLRIAIMLLAVEVTFIGVSIIFK